MNTETAIKTIKENIYGIEFEYLEGYEPTEEQILWMEILAYEASLGEEEK